MAEMSCIMGIARKAGRYTDLVLCEVNQFLHRLGCIEELLQGVEADAIRARGLLPCVDCSSVLGLAVCHP